MAPPRKGAAASEQAREKLTAIVLADSFTQRFRPVSVERAKVLLPLVNVPMLDYTLEWLTMNSMEEVYVFCCAHADQIQEHLRNAGWLSHRRCKVIPVVSTNCLSMGDALRLMDQKDIIKSDFVLVSGDVVTNCRLGDIIEAHQKRRASDKSAIMSVVMRGGITSANRLRLGDTATTVVMDPSTSRLLKFEDQAGRDASSARHRRHLRLDAHLFGERDNLTIRTDLLETGIYMCAPEVLMLFSDNFDYQNVRRDFISGVLSEEELGNKIFVHEVTKEYAARVHSLRSFDAVSRDIMARWVHPLVPETNLCRGTEPVTREGSEAQVKWGRQRTRYRYARGRVYLDFGVQIERTATVTNSCCVGTGTFIGEGAIIQECVIGRNCHIAPRAILRGCYLGSGVAIGEGAVLTSAMLCDNAVVKDGARVEKNSVLSFRVVVDRNAVVPSGARVSLVRQGSSGSNDSSDDELEVPQKASASPMRAFGGGSAGAGAFDSTDDDDEQEDGSDFGEEARPEAAALAAATALAADGIPEFSIGFAAEVVGPMGAGFVWRPARVEAAPGAAERWGLAPSFEALRLAQERPAGGEEDDDESDAEGTLEEEAAAAASAAGDGGDLAPAASGALELHFKREVAETFLRCVKENISHDNVVIELNGLKIAEDKTFADCARYMLTTALGLCLPPPQNAAKEYRGLYEDTDLDCTSKEGRMELLRRATAQLRRWTDLLRKFLKNEEDQVELLLTLEEFCADEGDFEGTGERGTAFASIFPQLLKVLYELDVAGEEAILQWAGEKEHADDDEKEFLRLAQPFLDWLQEAEEESSGSEEEESSGEE